MSGCSRRWTASSVNSSLQRNSLELVASAIIRFEPGAQMEPVIYKLSLNGF
jgi:hypothetical protein